MLNECRVPMQWLKKEFVLICLNPLVPKAHYSEGQDKPFYLQIERLEVDSKLNYRISKRNRQNKYME